MTPGGSISPPASPSGDVLDRVTSPTYILGMLTLVSFFNNLDRMIIAVLVEPIKRDLALSDSQMGLVAGFAFAMFYATLGIPLARIADRRSRITLMSICVALWSAMTALTGLARNFVELFLARMGVGVGEAGCAPAAHSLIGDLYPGERRAFGISIFQAGGITGQSVGLMIAALIAQYWGWRTALVVVGLSGIPVALALYFTVREPLRAPSHTQSSGESMGTTLKALLARPPLVHLMLGIGIAALGSNGMIQWLPAFFMRIHGMDLAEIGVFVGASGALGAVVGTVFGGYILTHLGRRDRRWELWWPMLVFAIYPIFTMPSFLVGDLRLVFVLQLFAAFVVSSGVGVALSAVQTFVEPHRRATAVAILLLSSALLGLGLGPVAVGGLSDLLAPRFGQDSLRWALIGSLFMPFWAAIHFWLASRSSKKWAIS